MQVRVPVRQELLIPNPSYAVACMQALRRRLGAVSHHEETLAVHGHADRGPTGGGSAHYFILHCCRYIMFEQLDGTTSLRASGVTLGPTRHAGLEVLYDKYDFRRYQSGQPAILSGDAS